MRKEKSDLTITSANQEQLNSSDKTPIEIALNIDENGMTTASRLYSFLAMDETHFARWCNKNIIKNKFSIENEDYFVLANDGDNVGRPKTDYNLTADFAKKLSMTGNTERHNQAREYFVACEQGLKVATAKLQENITGMKPFVDAITALTSTITTMQQDIASIKQSQTNRYLLEKRYPSAWYKKMAPKYKLIQDYFDCSRKELYSNIYKELEDTYDIDINQIHEDYCFENHLLKDECYPMDAIEHNGNLRDALTLLIDSSLVKFGLQTEEEIKSFKRKTIFDMPVNKIDDKNDFQTENYAL